MSFIKLCQIYIETQEQDLKQRKPLYIENYKSEITFQEPNIIFDVINCEVLQFESEDNYNNLNGKVINLTQNLTNPSGTIINLSDLRNHCLSQLKLIPGLESIQ